jgi:hypothetical protein
LAGIVAVAAEGDGVDVKPVKQCLTRGVRHWYAAAAYLVSDPAGLTSGYRFYFDASLLMELIRSLPIRSSICFCTGSSALRHSACSCALRL